MTAFRGFPAAALFKTFSTTRPCSLALTRPDLIAGVTDSVGGKEITVSASEFKVGRWSVAATLVHELAHVNGAGTDTIDAEKTLNCCGLNGLFRANAVGVRDPDEPDDNGPRYA